MSNTFTSLTVQCPSEITEILIAELSEAGFDTFLEDVGCFEASSVTGFIEAPIIEDILKHYQLLYEIKFRWKSVEKQNWNKEWENHYEPVIIDDKCLIRADFHSSGKQYAYEILINPKMSFGTGHHETTSLVISLQMMIDHLDKCVLDVGSGTGILSIMAELLGARKIDACDIDEWAVENSRENIALNQCKNINIYKGNVQVINQNKIYDILLANINKNILIAEMNSYAKRIATDGILIISGFLNDDIPELENVAMNYGMNPSTQKIQNNWAALVFQKKTA